MGHLSIIVATANRRVIGLNNTLPWHLPEDLQRFKALTMRHHIIMGRKTYESLGRLLPGRTTVIVTRNADYQAAGAKVFNSLETALQNCAEDTEPFLIGGAELYAAGLSFATKIYLTEIHADVVGDAYFPPLDCNQWHEVSRERHTSALGLDYSYVLLQRMG